MAVVNAFLYRSFAVICLFSSPAAYAQTVEIPQVENVGRIHGEASSENMMTSRESISVLQKLKAHKNSNLQ